MEEEIRKDVKTILIVDDEPPIVDILVYNLKKEVFKVVLGDYIEESDENYKNLDDILHKNLRFYSKKFFGDHFELPEIADVLASDELSTIQKRVKIKEYSTWYRNPADRKRFLIFSNLFMNNSFSYLPYPRIDYNIL